jgi:hypothetical protein
LTRHSQNTGTKRKAEGNEETQSVEPKRTKLADGPRKSLPSGSSSTPAPSSNSSTSAPTSSRGFKQKTITFDEVYQGGEAKFKHMIVTFNEKYYILKCDEHGVHFKHNPLAGAAKHLASQQHNMSKNYAVAVDALGYLVTDCNEEKKDMNNKFVRNALDHGYRPLNMNQLSKTERKSLGMDADFPVAAESQPQQDQNNAPWSPFSAGTQAPNQSPSAQHATRSHPGISRPEPGKLYLAYWAKEKRYYAVIMLPLQGDLAVAGLPGHTLQSIRLMKKGAPKCFHVEKNEIIDWTPGFEDGGPMEAKREFPVMYFDQNK